MTIKKLIWVATVAALFITIPVSAKTVRTPIEAIEYVCMNMPGNSWVNGNVLHVREQVNENVVVVNGEVWGINTAILSYDLNLQTGQIVGRARANFVPLGTDGGYSGTGVFRFEDFGATTAQGRAVLQGYGELKGQTMHQDLDALPPNPVTGTAICEGHGQYFSTTLWEGYTQSQE
jgi:hypothetical protein